MKLSVSVTNYSWAHRLRDRLASVAGFLDCTAVDTLWVPDHLLRQNADQVRQCQRMLPVKANVIIDAEACKPQAVTQGAEIVDQIEAKFPH